MRPDPRYLLGISILISGWSSGALASEPRCAISQNGQWSPQTEAQSLENCAAALKQRSEQTTGVLFARWNENLIGYDGAVFYVSQNNGETWTPTALRTRSTQIASTNAAEAAPELPSAPAPEANAEIREPASAASLAPPPTEAAPVVTAAATPAAPQPTVQKSRPAPTKSAPKPAAVQPAKPAATASVATPPPVAPARPAAQRDLLPSASEETSSLASVLASLPEPAEAEPAAAPAVPAAEKPTAPAKPSVAASQPETTMAAAQPTPPPAPPAPPKQLPGLPGAEGPAPLFPGLPTSATAIGLDGKGSTPCLIWNGNWVRSSAPDLRACANLLDQSPENYDEGGYKYAYWAGTYLVATRQTIKSLAGDGASWADVRKRYRY